MPLSWLKMSSISAWGSRFARGWSRGALPTTTAASRGAPTDVEATEMKASFVSGEGGRGGEEGSSTMGSILGASAAPSSRASLSVSAVTFSRFGFGFGLGFLWR